MGCRISCIMASDILNVSFGMGTTWEQEVREPKKPKQNLIMPRLRRDGKMSDVFELIMYTAYTKLCVPDENICNYSSFFWLGLR